MSGSPRLPARSPARLPDGVLGLDYLKFVQLSVDAELNREGSFDDGQLQDAMAAIRSGSMHTAQPAMMVFFDGCQFWLANHFHRYEAARRLGACQQEFWCEIQPGLKDHAVRYASRIHAIPRSSRGHSAPTG